MSSHYLVYRASYGLIDECLKFIEARSPTFNMIFGTLIIDQRCMDEFKLCAAVLRW